MLCESVKSQLVVIDVQLKLLDAMPDDERQQVLKSTQVLIKAAAILGVPVNVTEQYPKGLGHSHGSVVELIADRQVIEKTSFSCFKNSEFSKQLASDERRQIVICGIEAHVCVLQTAMDLMDAGYDVFVVEDAVCSRKLTNKHNALQRLQQAGGKITNMESVLFEWLRDAKHDCFKEISTLIR